MNSRPTADIVDEYGALALVCKEPFLQYGGVEEFAGPIATVRCAGDLALISERAGSPGAGRVLVVDAGGSLESAMAGDGIASRALTNGWAGIVIWGAVRDVGPLRGVKLGVSAIGTTPRAAATEGGGETDVPVEFGGVRFTPGSHLFSDLDGVVMVEQLKPRDTSNDPRSEVSP